MIENEQEYKVTKEQAQKFAKSIAHMERSLGELSDDAKEGRKQVIKFERSLLEELEQQMKEYERRTKRQRLSS